MTTPAISNLMGSPLLTLTHQPKLTQFDLAYRLGKQHESQAIVGRIRPRIEISPERMERSRRFDREIVLDLFPQPAYSGECVNGSRARGVMVKFVARATLIAFVVVAAALATSIGSGCAAERGGAVRFLRSLAVLVALILRRSRRPANGGARRRRSVVRGPTHSWSTACGRNTTAVSRNIVRCRRRGSIVASCLRCLI